MTEKEYEALMHELKAVKHEVKKLQKIIAKSNGEIIRQGGITRQAYGTLIQQIQEITEKYGNE